MITDKNTPVRWGVVATGGIAQKVTSDILQLPDVEVLAVSSRSQQRADEFAARNGIPRAYGDVGDLVADPDVDAVYVATPHAQHYEAVRAALLAGKAVLCEKPLTVSLADAEDLAALAKERGVFLMEAMWTRFNPLVKELRELVADGAIGEVRAVHADFGFAFPFNADHRLWDPAAGGGAILDAGVYPVSFAHMLLGEPESIEVHGTIADNGVDSHAAMLLRYPGGVYALAATSLLTPLPVTAAVMGTKGRIELRPPFFRPTEMVITRVGQEPEVRTYEPLGNGYGNQFEEVVARLRAGETESPHMRLDETVAVQRTLTTALDKLGVKYPSNPGELARTPLVAD